jgi:hypothetical protein
MRFLMSGQSARWTPAPRKRRFVWAALAAVLTVTALGIASPTTASATTCVEYLPAVSPLDMTAPTPTSGGCYTTTSAANAAAAANAPSSNTVHIGTDWKDCCANGDALVWYGVNGGCDSNTKYEDSYIGNDWNNTISSGGGAHNCSAFVHFQYPSFNENNPGGDSIRCGLLAYLGWCVYMDSMNDKTSSEKWHVAQ